jgi:hypothetical protein
MLLVAATYSRSDKPATCSSRTAQNRVVLGGARNIKPVFIEGDRHSEISSAGASSEAVPARRRQPC